MKLLADENQHPIVVARLRDAGHTVEWIRESSPGLGDADILSRTDIGTLVLLTYDRDFGDLIFNQRFSSPAAILYTRLSRADPSDIAERLLTLVEAGIATGHMTTITKNGARCRPFPLGASNG